MHRRNVVLPEPDGPMMHTTSRCRVSREIPRSTWCFPNHLFTSRARSTVVSGCAPFPGALCAFAVTVRGITSPLYRNVPGCRGPA